jgi:hypothetical protein
MEQRAPAVVETDDPVKRLFRQLNYFPTPPWAARAIAHRVKELDPGALVTCDPCCGEGHFAEPMKEVFGETNVLAGDIYDFGYGELADFLCLPPYLARRSVDWIVTNPPFGLAHEFVEQWLRIAQRGVVVLCRMAFLETDGREALLYEGSAPLTCIMPFVERVPMQLGEWNPNGSTATCYGAFAFHKGRKAQPHLPFKAGTRARFWRDDDPARFAKPAPIPMFEKMARSPLFGGG